MDYFTVAVTGGSVSDSLTSANVGLRSLICLKLKGQVSRLYKPTQIVNNAVPIPLAAGLYTFTIIGFSSAVSDATSVIDMYSRSPSLKAFFISQLTASVVPGQALQLKSAYDGVSAPDLNPGCLLSSGTLYALTLTGTFPYLYRKIGGSWTNDLLPAGGTSDGTASLAGDSSGNAMAALGSRTTGGVGFSMLPNVYQQIISNVDTSGTNGVAIAVTGDGLRHAIGNYYNGASTTGAEYFSSGGAWARGTSFLPSGSTYENFRAVAGPNNTIVASANSILAAAPMSIALKGSNGVWGAVGTVSDVGGTSCMVIVTKTALAFDSQGFAYGAYVCGAAQDKIGIVHNRSGSWANFLAINANGTAINDVDLYTVGGTMHLVYDGGVNVSYSSMPEGGIVFSPPSIIRTMPLGDRTIQLGLVGADASHLHVMGMETFSTFTRLVHTTNETGSWQTEVVSGVLGASDTLHKRIFLR